MQTNQQPSDALAAICGQHHDPMCRSCVAAYDSNTDRILSRTPAEPSGLVNRLLAARAHADSTDDWNAINDALAALEQRSPAPDRTWVADDSLLGELGKAGHWTTPAPVDAWQQGIKAAEALCRDFAEMVADMPPRIEPKLTNMEAWERVRDGAEDLADAIRALKHPAPSPVEREGE